VRGCGFGGGLRTFRKAAALAAMFGVAKLKVRAATGAVPTSGAIFRAVLIPWLGCLAAGSSPSAATPRKNIPPPSAELEPAPHPEVPPVTQQPAPLPPSTQPREQWRQLMWKTPPPKGGCYSSSYPNTEWHEVPCTTAPPLPHAPAAGITPPDLVGGVDPDLVAQASGPLSSSTGSLYSVTGVTSVAGPGQNSFQLQLNTNTFGGPRSPLCGNQSNCFEWQQFIYQNTGCLQVDSKHSCVYIQYWLVNHTSPCPTTPTAGGHSWNYFGGGPGQSSGCYINGNTTPVPDQTVVAGLRLKGNTSAGAQSAVFEDSTGTSYNSSDGGDLLGMGASWRRAEFNIFGNCCGNQAVFNPGSTIVVLTNVDDGTANVPTPVRQSYTAESNNLTLVSPPCLLGGSQQPGILFTESNGDATSTCPDLTPVYYLLFEPVDLTPVYYVISGQ
jgi:hypothetical protein